MSFRTRLTTFFAVIVVIPMLAVGVLVFRLISDSERGKADANLAGAGAVAASLYSHQMALARTEAQAIGRLQGALDAPGGNPRLAEVAGRAGLVRIAVRHGSHTVFDLGDRTAIAPGVAELSGPRHATRIAVAVLSAGEYAKDLARAPSIHVVVRQRRRLLASSLPVAQGDRVPVQGTMRLGGDEYRIFTERFPGFGRGWVEVTLLSSVAAAGGSSTGSRVVAAVFIVVFLLLALAFSLLASRALQGQVSRFLGAARRLGGGDFSKPVATEGGDEFAELAAEFNSMSEQLERRMNELTRERARLRESLGRIGQTMAANLDPRTLLEVALRTAVDAVEADRGRVTARGNAEDRLREVARIGELEKLEDEFHQAERQALSSGDCGSGGIGEPHVLAVPLGKIESSTRTHGVITVARSGAAFSDADFELLRSLASQTTLALENVELHVQARRRAVTDELTGLANHGRFQDLLVSEMEQVRRYHYPVALIMLDIDNFKRINDTYGHPQGDLVLRQVAKVVRESSREADTPARYGGEEMAVILPHTDLEGSYAIAERIRTAVEGLEIPRLSGPGTLRVTASLGVASAAEGDRHGLVAEADAALYQAKRAGKNRTCRAEAGVAYVVGGE